MTGLSFSSSYASVCWQEINIAAKLIQKKRIAPIYMCLNVLNMSHAVFFPLLCAYSRNIICIFAAVMKQKAINLLLLLLLGTTAFAQPKFSKPHGLYSDQQVQVAISGAEGAELRYTTDGSEPTRNSRRYTQPLTLKQTTILRAVEVFTDSLSPIATSSYIFEQSVLSQSNNPEGYPSEWGKYTQSEGIAKADYEMDPEMTGDATLRPKILEGLHQLPILSIVSDKDNFFSHENDSVRGGIYIFTGPPVGDPTGHGWTRPASIELIGGPQEHDLTAGCGIRLHGGHGRLAEKNPKHSFRLVFKKEYGQKSLKYPLFGEDEPSKFDQLVLRCHFGNAWQHWGWGNNSKAQYTRDVWARRMQHKMGWTSVNALYVHVFLNGMYWGLYNIAERVDDQFGKDHLGGTKSDIDVIKIEEDGGYHIEAAKGDMDAWYQMVTTAANAGNDTYYYKLQGKDANGEDDSEQEALLDIDAFIDYMLINQYGGNNDWDHHNWYALRRKGADSEGFRFLCWDSELILENAGDNVLNKNNGMQFPTGIFQSLLQNQKFARRYLKRAKVVLAEDGFLGQQSAVELWDSLYNTINMALYDEAARWGDYRRDVHRYNTYDDYQLCTVDGTYMNERNRLLREYFPVRTNNVLNAILGYVNIDDFEMPDDWTPLIASMFKEWNGVGASAQPTGNMVNVDWNFNMNASGGTAVAGFGNVEFNRYADVSEYESLALRGTGTELRILANRLVDHGPVKEIVVSFNNNDPYWDNGLDMIVLPLANFRTMADTQGNQRVEDYVHINAIKVNWNNTVNLKGAYLIKKPDTSDMATIKLNHNDGNFYSLSGQRVTRPTRGIYIQNGKKRIVR